MVLKAATAGRLRLRRKQRRRGKKEQSFEDEDPKKRALERRTLRLGDKLQIPVDVAVRKLAWIGKSGSGKSWGVGLMLEQMRLNGVRFIVIDPVGTHTGIAQMEGVMFHAVQRGMNVGKFCHYILENDLNVVINLRGLTFEDQRLFLRLFAEELYRSNKEYGPRHLVVEEVHQFAPQGAKSEAKEMMQVLSTMGRMEGIGLSVVTQRPAIVDKTVIANTDCFVFYQLMLPQDLGAVTEVLTAKTNMPKEEEAKIDAIIAAMPSLGKGEVTVYSPEWLQMAERCKLNGKRFTPHSGTTPDNYVRPIGDEPGLAETAPFVEGDPEPIATSPVPHDEQSASPLGPPPTIPLREGTEVPALATPTLRRWHVAAAAAGGLCLFPALYLPLRALLQRRLGGDAATNGRSQARTTVK